LNSKDFKEIFFEIENLEILMSCLNFYKKNQKPSLSEELETFENLFDSLCSLLLEFEISENFRKLEGIEFLISFIKKKKFARNSSIKALNYCLLNNEKNVKRFIQQDGIKILFPSFLKQIPQDGENAEHIISCLVSTMKIIESYRFIDKFKESEFEKLDHLFDFFLHFRDTLFKFDRNVKNGSLNEIYQEIDDDLIFFERLNAGLNVYQLIVHIFAFVSEDESIRDRIELLLSQRALNPLDVLNLLGNSDEFDNIIILFKKNFNISE
jgi:hypothetical protein